MRDKKGFLPAHVACSRHCSPEKLEMLLQVNSDSLFAETDDGRTLLGLAESTATKQHPNKTLIDDLKRRLQIASTTVSSLTDTNPFHVQSSFDRKTDYWNQSVTSLDSTIRTVVHTSRIRNSRQSKFKNCKAKLLKRKTQNVLKSEVCLVNQEMNTIKQEDCEPANLLLHFSRHMENIASV